jgi:hypothetical protein
MLTLHGKLERAVLIPGSTNKKTGEIYHPRSVVQVQVDDRRGLAQLVSLTVPDHRPYVGKEGQEVAFPVRAFAPGATVQFVLAEDA